jgi:hypothetical protein
MGSDVAIGSASAVRARVAVQPVSANLGLIPFYLDGISGNTTLRLRLSIAAAPAPSTDRQRQGKEYLDM